LTKNIIKNEICTVYKTAFDEQALNKSHFVWRLGEGGDLTHKTSKHRLKPEIST
jgi:hypothetical protein